MFGVAETGIAMILSGLMIMTYVIGSRG